MFPLTRRALLQHGTRAAAAVMVPYATRTFRHIPLVSSLLGNTPTEACVDFVDPKALAAAALTAATQAGAQYVDVNFRRTQVEEWIFFSGVSYPIPQLHDMFGAGVRVLVNGCWGFAGISGPLTVDTAAQLGKDAAAQATVTARVQARDVALAATPLAVGEWVMPGTDPFTVSFAEKADFFCALNDFVKRRRYSANGATLPQFRKEQRTFASSEGAFASQVIYRTAVSFGIGCGPDWISERVGSRQSNLLTPAGAGWEYVLESPIRDRVDAMIEYAFRVRRPKPVDVGRYDIVFDAQTAANILDGSIGAATELDRAMGYLANSVGTSYLNDPLAMLGTQVVGSPMLTVTANRTMPRGAATVRWDDEGVAPAEATLMRGGVLHDYQTTRESATWLAPYYQRAGLPIRSSGCAGVYDASAPLGQCPPNLVMAPGSSAVTMDDMIKTVKQGLAVFGGSGMTDQQQLNGTGRGDHDRVFEIVNGKLGAAIEGAEYVYRSPEFWRNLVAVGGAQSVEAIGITRSREERDAEAAYTIAAVPITVRDVVVTDAMRKA
jgi:TldD protein